MNTITRDTYTVPTRLRPVSAFGIATLAVTKTTDLLTTIVGLTIVDGLTERNPVAASIFESTGVTGLVLASIASVLVVVLVVEWAVNVINSNNNSTLDCRVVYFVSYVPLCLLFGFTSVHNLVLIVRVGLV